MFYLFPQAVQICPDYDVFITKKDFKTVKNCNTSTAVVRSLLTKVFTDKAVETCSVSGKVPSNGDEVRPALDQDGVDAIIGKNSDFFLMFVKNVSIMLSTLT